MIATSEEPKPEHSGVGLMDMNDKAQLLDAIGAIAGIAAYVLMYGFALSTLWGWFFVTTFGLPQIGIAQAAGISLTLGTTRPSPQSDKNETAWSILWKTMRRLLIALAIGYALTFFL